MKLVIQRVYKASVTIENKVFSSVNEGLLIFVGVENADNLEDILWLTKKICALRIFDDENGIMNRSIIDINGDILVISQFTLHASTKKGNRPSFIKASKSEIARPLYEKFILELESELGKKVSLGIFGSDMQVSLINNGPVTIVIDSKNRE